MVWPANFPSMCPSCQLPIELGKPVRWAVVHDRCQAGGPFAANHGGTCVSCNQPYEAGELQFTGRNRIIHANNACSAPAKREPPPAPGPAPRPASSRPASPAMATATTRHRGVSKPFEAQRDGTCTKCKRPYGPGDKILFNSKNLFEHDFCPLRDEP